MSDGPAKPGPAADRLMSSLNKSLVDANLERSGRLGRFLRTSRRRFQRMLYERDVQTADRLVGIDHFHPDRVSYYPSGWRYLRRILRRGDVGPDDVFVDLGCGKGRVLLQAAAYPFKRVIGVEIDAELSALAQANVDRRRDDRRCGDVEVVTADAAEYVIPDDATVVYLYYPFSGDTFRTVIENIVVSIDRAPRTLRIIYALPALEGVILETGRFRLARTSRSRVDEELRLYEST
jgi:SAM-dependent methyltransferase